MNFELNNMHIMHDIIVCINLNFSLRAVIGIGTIASLTKSTGCQVTVECTAGVHQVT